LRLRPRRRSQSSRPSVCNFRGSLPLGAHCVSDAQCLGRCKKGNAGDLACGLCGLPAPQDLATAGQSCSGDSGCVSGLSCIGPAAPHTDYPTCVRPGGEGEACPCISASARSTAMQRRSVARSRSSAQCAPIRLPPATPLVAQSAWQTSARPSPWSRSELAATPSRACVRWTRVALPTFARRSPRRASPATI